MELRMTTITCTRNWRARKGLAEKYPSLMTLGSAGKTPGRKRHLGSYDNRHVGRLSVSEAGFLLRRQPPRRRSHRFHDIRVHNRLSP